jgi:hypothetical protein
MGKTGKDSEWNVMRTKEVERVHILYQVRLHKVPIHH